MTSHKNGWNGTNISLGLIGAVAVGCFTLLAIASTRPSGQTESAPIAAHQIAPTDGRQAQAGSSILPRAGAPRDWEGGLTFASYSIVNLVNGNLLTTLPITGWSGR